MLSGEIALKNKHYYYYYVRSTYIGQNGKNSYGFQLFERHLPLHRGSLISVDV